MNAVQQLWIQQARADLELFEHLRGFAAWQYQCHALQALQMAAEKVAKASFRADGATAAKLSHVGLTKMIRRLAAVNGANQVLLAKVFSAETFERFERLLKSVRGVAREVERLVPALAGPERENTEYPWPHSQAIHAPARWEFSAWRSLETSKGRELLRFLSRAIEGFEQYSDVFRP